MVGGDVLSGVKDQLASSEKQVLLVLDNCDDMKIDYNRYIPHGSQVNVILTTRLSDARNYASVDPRNPRSKLFFQLSGLDACSAIDLLLESSHLQGHSQQCTDQAKHIVTALDCHPLAIIVSSSLIRSGVYSLVEYVDALQRQFAQKEVLDEESVHARYRRVSATFEVSAEALQSASSTDPSAKAALALLDMLGFMHHQDVSEEIFVRAWEYEQTVLSKYEHKDRDDEQHISRLSAWHVARCRSIWSPLPLCERIQLLRKARAHLHRLSLVSVDRTQRCMSLHLLVHSWAKDRVKRPIETWSAVAATLALSAEGSLDWQPYTSQLIPHYEANLSICQDLVRIKTDQWEICKIIYIYAYQMLWAKSITTLSSCLHLLEHVEGLFHHDHEQPAIVDALHLLGLAYHLHDQAFNAIQVLEHVVKVREKLAEDHASRMASQGALAKAYLKGGQVSKGTNMLEHAVKVGEKKLAEDHPDRLAFQHGLAHAYLEDGRVVKAIDMLENVVKINEEKLAKDHPDRLGSQHELARAYLADGRVAEAIDMLENVTKVGEEKLAEDHPSRIASQHALAGAYLKNGQITEAIAISEHMAKLQEKLADDHPNRLSSRHLLAGVKLQSGQITEAVDILEDVVEIKQKSLAEDHPSRLASQYELARAYWSNRQKRKALELLKSVVAIDQRKYSAGHPNRTKSENMLAKILKHEKELALERRRASDLQSSSRAPDYEIDHDDQGTTEVVPIPASREKGRNRKHYHLVPAQVEADQKLKPSKRERLKMVFRPRKR